MTHTPLRCHVQSLVHAAMCVPVLLRLWSGVRQGLFAGLLLFAIHLRCCFLSRPVICWCLVCFGLHAAVLPSAHNHSALLFCGCRFTHTPASLCWVYAVNTCTRAVVLCGCGGRQRTPAAKMCQVQCVAVLWLWHCSSVLMTPPAMGPGRLTTNPESCFQCALSSLTAWKGNKGRVCVMRIGHLDPRKHSTLTAGVCCMCAPAPDSSHPLVSTLSVTPSCHKVSTE